jgi:hypothetical protein
LRNIALPSIVPQPWARQERFETLGSGVLQIVLDAPRLNAVGAQMHRATGPRALVYCLGEGLVIQTSVINGTCLAFMSMDLSVKRPAYVGDTIHVVVEVTQARAASTGQRGVVTTKNSVRSQRGEDVLIYTPGRLIRGHGYQAPGEASDGRRQDLLPNGLGSTPATAAAPGRRTARLP